MIQNKTFQRGPIYRQKKKSFVQFLFNLIAKKSSHNLLTNNSPSIKQIAYRCKWTIHLPSDKHTYSFSNELKTTFIFNMYNSSQNNHKKVATVTAESFMLWMFLFNCIYSSVQYNPVSKWTFLFLITYSYKNERRTGCQRSTAEENLSWEVYKDNELLLLKGRFCILNT